MLLEVVFAGNNIRQMLSSWQNYIQSSLWPDVDRCCTDALVAIYEYVRYNANVILNVEHIDNWKLHFQTVHDISQHMVIHDMQSMHIMYS